MLEQLDPRTPRLIGPYQLLARLGAGGMGEVCLARPVARTGAPEDAPRGLVAVKTVRQDLDLGSEFRTRFIREAEAARAVRSPYTAELVAAGERDERPWLATEYVAGPSLTEAVARGGPLPAPAVRALGVDLARALAAIHGARVLHRDLKPANVLLGPDGPKVIDFGIANAFDATALTATGLVIGTPGFMSPEHVNDAAAIAPASDVFSLGGLLCFAATGRSPFDDPELAAVLHRIAQGEADLTGLPEELRGTVERCLQPDPERRPRPEELIAELDEPGIRADGLPWPAPVQTLIGEYAAAVGSFAAAAAPLPPRPGFGPPPVPPEPVLIDAAQAAGGEPEKDRRPLGLRVAVSAVIGAVAGALVAVLLPLLGVGEGGGGASAKPPGQGKQPAGQRALALAVEENGGAIISTSDFGAGGADFGRRPEGWKAWQARMDGRRPGCALLKTALLCAHDKGVELRDLGDGSLKWRYGGGGTYAPEVAGDRVYVTNRQGGTTALRLRDGTELSSWPAGTQGYNLGRIVAGKGVVYAGYVGPAGERAASNMLFRAYREKDGKLLWEQVVKRAYPLTMTLTSAGLLLPGEQRIVLLDLKTGKRIAEGSTCLPALRYRASVLCAGLRMRDMEVRGVKTLRPGAKTLPLHARAVGGGIALGLATDASGQNTGFRAVRIDTGKPLWTRPVPASQMMGEGPLLMLGDSYLAVTDQGVQRFSLADGKPLSGLVKYPGWPRNPPGTTYAPLAMAHGGVLYLIFNNGQIFARKLP